MASSEVSRCAENFAHIGGSPALARMAAKHMNKFDKEHGATNSPCPRCGADAQWTRDVTDNASSIQVVCAECGSFEMPRPEFDTAVSEIVAPDAPE